MQNYAHICRFFLSALLVSFSACNESGEISVSKISTNANQSADSKSPDSWINYEPTNQVGGIIPGKPERRDPRILAEIRQKNSLQPIVWGKSIGALSLDMQEYIVNDRLSAKLHSTANSDRYAEGIQIVWQPTNPRMPQLIAASKDYQGRLKMDQTIGDLYIGRDLTSVLNKMDGTHNLMRALGRVLEKQNSDYDCRIALTCRLSYFNELIYFDFKLGGMTIDTNNEINQIYLKNNRNIFYPRLNEDIIFGESIAGITLTSLQDDVENRIGPPQGLEQFIISHYDDFNLSIIWKPDHTPFQIVAKKGYLGKIVFGQEISPGISTLTMGDSLAQVIPVGDSGQQFTEFLKTSPFDDDLEMIAIHLGNKVNGLDDEAQNCLAEGTCQITETATSYLIQFLKGSIAVTKDQTRQINLVMLAERPNQ
jgi:hypothetical protein